MSVIARFDVTWSSRPWPARPSVRSWRSPIVKVPDRFPAASAAPINIVLLMPPRQVPHAAPVAVEVTVTVDPEPTVTVDPEPTVTVAAPVVTVVPGAVTVVPGPVIVVPGPVIVVVEGDTGDNASP